MKKINYIGILGTVLVIITAAAFLPSCREKPAISNQIIVTGIGLTETDAGCTLSIQAVEALKTAGSLSEQTENATAVYHAKGASVAQALQAFLNEAGRSTYILHNQIIGLGMEQYRNRSVFQTLDYFVRNLEGRSLVDLVICRDDPADLLSIQSGNDPIPSEYVSQLIQEGSDWGIAVKARLLDAQRASSGMYDMMIPLVEVKEKTPRLDGTALFRKGYLAGELTTEQTTGILFAADKIEKCLYTVEGVTFRITASSTKLHIEPFDGAYRYTFSIKGTADITETQTQTVFTQSEKDRLLSLLEEQICVDIQEAVQLAVFKYGCDPLALARRTAKEYGITQEQASALLPESEYRFSADIRLAESGFLS